ncbi:hypothetical protein [Bartonella sp. AD328YNZD]
MPELQTLGAYKICDGINLLLHKPKDGELNGFIVILFTGSVVKWTWKH